MKHPDAVYNSDKLDKSESAFYPALPGKEKTEKQPTKIPLWKWKIPFQLHTTLVLAFIEERRAMFKWIIPRDVSRLQRPGPTCVELSEMCVC